MKKKYRRLCPFCKDKKGEFIQHTKERIEIHDNGESIENSFVREEDEPRIVCFNCAKEVTDEELIRGEEVEE